MLWIHNDVIKGTILPDYKCPRPYEVMFNRLQASGVTWMRFYEFQWSARCNTALYCTIASCHVIAAACDLR